MLELLIFIFALLFVFWLFIQKPKQLSKTIKSKDEYLYAHDKGQEGIDSKTQSRPATGALLPVRPTQAMHGL